MQLLIPVRDKAVSICETIHIPLKQMFYENNPVKY